MQGCSQVQILVVPCCTDFGHTHLKWTERFLPPDFPMNLNGIPSIGQIGVPQELKCASEVLELR